MNFENLIISVENKIAIVTLNRPNKLNALNKSTLEELHIAFTQFEQDDLVQAIKYLQDSGIHVVACTEKASVPLYETNLRGAVAMIMGSEMDGMTSDLINLADISCKIPMKGEIASLNVSVAAGMVLYEKLRQELH